MASITKRGDTYRIRVFLGRDENENVKFEAIAYKPSATTPKAIEKEVKAFADDFEKRVKEGKYLSGEKMTYREVAKRWNSDWASKSLSDDGADYMKIIERYAYPAFGDIKISKITPMSVQSLINSMEDQGLSSGTIRRAMVAINSVFRYAYRMNIIHENPYDRCELPKMDQDDALHIFTREQSQVFLNKALTMTYKIKIKAHDRIDDTGKKYHVKEYFEEHQVPLQFRVLYTLALVGGFRRGELAALTWKDIDFKNKIISINKSAALRGGEYIIKSPKTKAGTRDVVMPDYCFDLLRKWKTEEEELRFSLGTAWEGPKEFEDANLFIQATGKMIDLNTIGHKFRAILDYYNESVKKDENKLPIIRLHDLRHTCASLLIASGCDPAIVAQRLGHSSIITTFKNYTHAMNENDYKASNMIALALALAV